MSNTKVNYSAEMVSTMVEAYQTRHGAGDSNDVILADLATVMGRSVRSVRAKLVREGVYVAPVKVKAAPRDLGPTKGELLQTLADNGFDVEGLEGATKPAIERVIALVVGNAMAETEDDTAVSETETEAA